MENGPKDILGLLKIEKKRLEDKGLLNLVVAWLLTYSFFNGAAQFG